MTDPRLDRVEAMLRERGPAVGPVRVAVGRSGLAAGRPQGPMIHLAWGVVAALAVAAVVLGRRR